MQELKIKDYLIGLKILKSKTGLYIPHKKYILNIKIWVN